MKKVKAVKKIPKYDGGGIIGPGKLSAPKYNFDPSTLSGNINSSGGGVTPRGIISSGNGDKFNWANAAALAGNTAGAAAGMLGIELGDVAHAANIIGDVANLIPGVGPYISVGIKTIGALSGAGGNVDETTGKITKSSGLTRWLGWGRSDESLAQKSNRITNRNIAAQQSSRMQMEWKNNPNVEPQPAVLAKDGGVIPNTMWYEDDGEWGRLPDGTLYKEPEEGKPTDSNLVVGPSGTQILSDKQLYPGTKQTIAEHFEKSISKVKNYGNDKYAKNSQMLNDRYAQKQFDEHLRIQEEVKNMKQIKKLKNGIPAHEGGLNPYGFNDDITQFAYWDKDKNDYKKEYLDWVNSITEQDVKDIYSGVYGDMSTYLGKNKGYIPTVTEARRLLTDKKYGDWHKIGQQVASKMLSKPNKVKITNFDPERKVFEQMQKNNVFPSTTLKRPVFIKPVERGEEEVETTDNKKKFDLSDLYRGLSVITPFSDRVRPRVNTLNRPTFKPIPVDVDPTNLLLDAQLGYALNNYNTSRGGFTAGQQLAAANVAASNLATQRANIHQWEKEQELKNITQNIMAYNDYSKLLAEIGNTEIDINDRNRAAANTINNTNRKSALNALGSIAKEMKQEKIDAQDRERKYTMLEPLIKEVYENSDELLPLLQGKIKKVKKTKKSTKTEKE